MENESDWFLIASEIVRFTPLLENAEGLCHVTVLCSVLHVKLENQVAALLGSQS